MVQKEQGPSDFQLAIKRIDRAKKELVAIRTPQWQSEVRVANKIDIPKAIDQYMEWMKEEHVRMEEKLLDWKKQEAKRIRTFAIFFALFLIVWGWLEWKVSENERHLLGSEGQQPSPYSHLQQFGTSSSSEIPEAREHRNIGRTSGETCCCTGGGMLTTGCKGSTIQGTIQ